MTNELDKLKKAWAEEPEIKASEHAKTTAMSAAMYAFAKHNETENSVEKIASHEFSSDIQNATQRNITNKNSTLKENSKNTQGNSSGSRQKEQDHNDVGLFNLSYWRKLMKLSYLVPVATAGALAVSAWVLMPLLSDVDEKRIITTSEMSESKDGSSFSHKEAIAMNTHKPKNARVHSSDHDSDGVTASPPGDTLKGNPEADVASITEAPREKKSDKAVHSLATAKVRASAEVAQADLKPKRSATGYINESVSPATTGAKLQKPSPLRERKENHASGDVAQPMLVDQVADITPEPEIQQHNDHKGRDKFASIKINPLKFTQKEPLSTFSIDVDTAAYSFMRASINRNTLPQKNAVRVEELINYFPYDYPQPADSKHPFQVNTSVMPTPWNAHTKLLHIGIKGYQLPRQEKPKSNLVFLLDTSGSMNQANKLPLLKNSFKLLLSTLQPDDTVSIVAYAGSAGTVLAPTKVAEKNTIIQALERLSAGGSTAGGEGIRLAYQLAQSNYHKNAVNRVILATDGDFNVGISNQEELKSFIERKRQSGVFLSVLGFGMGNYNDALMQTLAQNGNGNAAYIDSLSEARKVLVEEASSTLFTIAKDVKIQMEFNPKVVGQYRLIGYETRALKREDFNNDKVDAGEIGAGHTVTAFYEMTLVNAQNKPVDPLRYGVKQDKNVSQKQTEYGFLKLRYKRPDEDKSQLIETPIHITDTTKSIEAAPNEARFATAVAAFGQLLRGGTYTHTYSYDDIIALAQHSKGEDPFGYRAEFITLVRLAKTAE